MQGHGCKQGIAPLCGKYGNYLTAVIVQGLIPVILAVSQKPYFYIVHLGFHKLPDNAFNRMKTEIPIVDVPAVTEGTVQ
jgi:hypothetical protein